ncbi:unnamed protein product [Rotaria sp. Silwood2]|nr:unnamed protein product [Rotaria sp. Silwood2]CAF2505865.1 unnamed protein product [Rotaria sp. Silwood2]CAF2904671.1 unnamed protein product [Rotaria sp. Silwood2]CAF3252527.1 unnamed protein product [Rotaria sp. Silwood2]CAF4282584.1 unnamed protein product [Rotaria sp. Silwood2]
MWHLCRLTSRPLIGAYPILIRQRALIPIQPSTPQRLFSFPSFFKIKKHLPESLPQPPVNPRHPPDYIPLRPSIDPNVSKPIQSQSSIFARFHHAYAKYGKILLAVHFVSSFAWFSGLLLLHFNGYDLGMYIMNGLVQIHVISPERRLSFIRHMNEFSISGILSKIPFLSQERRNQLNAYWTGERVRLLATVLLLYKFLTPIRYAFTLGVTTYVSRTFLKRGFIKRAPQGDSLQELYHDQKLLIKSHVRRAREKIKTSARRGAQKPE